MRKICGNPNCSCSTGIHGGLTFGEDFDFNGFPVKPCKICADHHNATILETKQAVAKDMKAQGFTNKKIGRYITTAEWLTIPA